MFNGKRVFISGGAGVIGKVLTDNLLKKGADIFIGDLKPKPKDFPEKVIYRQGDLNFIDRRELLDFSPEYFFHLAATFERSIETYGFWDENYHHNIRLSHHLISILKSCPTLEKVVFASSYLVYDPHLYSSDQPADNAYRLKETDNILPRNICGVAKFLHEMELKFLTSFPETSFEAVSARIFRSYGKESQDIISRWIRTLLTGEGITIFKEEGLFDYIYASEVAEGLLRLAAPGITGVVNLGNDNARRISEVVSVLRMYFPDLKISNVQSDDIAYEASQADMGKFISSTAWQPDRQIEDVIPVLIGHERGRSKSRVDEYCTVNILVTSISRKVPLLRVLRQSVEKLTNKFTIFGGDSDNQCIGRYFVDEFWHMPEIDQLNIDNLVLFCRCNDINVIVPTRDGELAYFARNRDKLSANGIAVMVSDLSGVEICSDKLLFYEALRDIQEIQVIPAAIDPDGITSSSYVVKEQYGAGSLKIALDISREDAVKFASGLAAPVYQPYIKGREYSVDVYIAGDGRHKGGVVRSRDMVVNGESQISTTVHKPELEKICFYVANILNLRWHLVFQVLEDHSGSFHLIECNCRFGGASTLSLAVGLDSFYWFLLESQGEDISKYPFLRTKKNLIQIRHAEDLVIHDSGF